VTGVSRHWLATFAGAIAGASLWAVNMQLGQILPYVECGSRYDPELVVTAAAAAASLLCGWVSWRSTGRSFARSTQCSPVGFPDHAEAANRAFRFAATVSALLGVMFAFALLLQAASTLILTGCER
jgi:hypothetical protein